VTTYAYDANGSLTGTWVNGTLVAQYTYDPQNHLSQFQSFATAADGSAVNRKARRTRA
jgi:YD repeat-containing protein